MSVDTLKYQICQYHSGPTCLVCNGPAVLPLSCNNYQSFLCFTCALLASECPMNHAPNRLPPCTFIEDAAEYMSDFDYRRFSDVPVQQVSVCTICQENPVVWW